jgi:hypothetical protein
MTLRALRPAEATAGAGNARSVSAGLAVPAARTAMRARTRTGWTLIALASLFLAFDAAGKLLRLAPVIEGTAQLGYSTTVIGPLGIVLLGSLITYLVPRTAIVGAVLLTGYLGGATATHVRMGNPLLTHTLFPIYVAVLIWGGLFLVDERLRAAVGPKART